VTAPIHVLAFAGSLRAKSHNRGLITAAQELTPTGMTIEEFDLAPIPLYNHDIMQAGLPDPVQAFAQRITAADALLIATPEYNYSVPGVLKNAIDWVSRPGPNRQPAPLSGKPAAIMGAGGRFGTVRAQAHLRYILLAIDVKVLNKPELMVVRSWEQFDDDGRLADENARQQLSDLLHALHDWAAMWRSVRTG
jgi:chromate reductase, NAD(P)H dehydrogenase (quinone)